LLLEEHRTIGKPMQCGGLVSPRLRGLVDFSFPVLNTVKGAYVFGPDGQEFEILSREEKGLIVDRTEFDRRAAGWAVRKGAELRLGSPVESLSISGNGVIAKIRGGKEAEAEVVIGAEGPNSITVRAASLSPFKEMVTGCEIEAIGSPRNLKMVEVFAGERVGKGFFAWVIPTGEDSLRIGAGVQDSPYSARESLHYLMTRSPHRERFQGIQPLSLHAGGIPIGMRERLYFRRALVIGDAAGMAKPVSGGGIITGLISAGIAAEVVDEAINSGDFSSHALAPYQKRLLGEIGKELKRAWRLRKAFMHLPDPELNRLFSLLSAPEAGKVMNERGDIDYPGRMALELLRASPGLLRFALKYLGKSFFL
ncbi:MAG: NAD(P)/FAD-dependent oxidoreductase, partial [Thermoplasmata archaeon]|nr:NAD(P)/FAD-dependent oxidoreductase [Thermoplasmata archaeon]